GDTALDSSFEHRYGQIIVQARLWNGPRSGLSLLALDTGATLTVVKPKVLADLGLDTDLPAERITMTTGSRSEEVGLFTMDRVESLGRESFGLVVACHPLPTKLDVDGLLGLNFFRGRRLTLDFLDGTIRLEERPNPT